MRFIPATETHIPLIRDLAARSWKSAYSDILSEDQISYMLENMYSEKEISAHLQHRNYHYYLLMDEHHEEFLGFIGFENHYEPETTKLHRIYLVPESKGKGFGKKALKFLNDHAIEAGDKRVILNVNKYNPARAFYESQGYTVYDEGVFDIGHGYIMDDYLMEFFTEG
ncbi:MULTISPECIES: GNAT family N-acetyltransferase [Chryseobacterium]|uniref:GNAT superfamily N-acetyltransferase n=1 Tax=Chryseobacterium camelliae TaxID=1265445 RepID=A0ABU0TFH8_9FLAO|nr:MULTISPECIES: GNAT family N-acetyltransferase [Chryseobacterium]MDT3407180.1 GNAT superfamily N-acetyltransferase [Pseudacidovorax intermedius]MDQ1095030.1 GNAT superfamily N-acetyltransferase [Chryseobacterium camelliae]MDQ1098969.1 GNAT superfamily N-acetyltransferase [Chryseobacterium sp. SORGH_AS_1048]MDR6086317.1 GNAT superfamily N-acetyltransferase [Chryseobacterium sp. SORGH_AS_0909]MDR6130689.1 GNAT superfamily N-acetyltransferase [Chryseobacterium sp. SORGH_AS_1175]